VDHWNHPWQQPFVLPNDPNWYSSHTPRSRYHQSECNICPLIGHIRWNCPGYTCPFCRVIGPGHKPDACPRRKYATEDNCVLAGLAIVPDMSQLTQIFGQKSPNTQDAVKNLLNSLQP